MNNIRSSTQHLVTATHQFDPNYQGNLTNHLPMALVALDLSGASEARIQRFYDHYVKILDPKKASRTAKQPQMSNRDHFNDWQAFFLHEIHSHGIETCLKTQLPVLVEGIAAAAFHGLIRLSYAIDLGSPDEISHALAYLASEYQYLGDLQTTNSYSLDEQIVEGHNLFYQHSFEPGIIVDRVQEVIESERYVSISAIPDTLPLEKVCDVILKQFIRTNDFTYLHGVTGLQAFINILPYLQDQTVGLQRFWQAYVAAYCASSPYAKATDCAITHPSKNWQQRLQRASQSNDDHTIKLVFSCYRIDQSHPTPLSIQAAEMRLAKESL